MEEFAPGKINLFLDVINKREDGYHNLGTVFQTINAGDYVSAEETQGVITLTYNTPQEYPVESDLVYKAAVALKNFSVTQGKLHPNAGARIYLEKVLPLGAGLGGGSADAAATLRLLNRLWNLNYSFKTLEEIGAKLGADVPFLVQGGTAFAEGIGDKLTFIPPLELSQGEFLLVCTPKDFVPTKDAYAGVVKSGPNRWESYKLKAKNPDFLLYPTSFFNGFETSVFVKHKLVEELKAMFLNLGAKSALMSGSGASVFGIFNSKASAESAAEKMASKCRYQKITGFFSGFLENTL